MKCYQIPLLNLYIKAEIPLYPIFSNANFKIVDISILEKLWREVMTKTLNYENIATMRIRLREVAKNGNTRTTLANNKKTSKRF